MEESLTSGIQWLLANYNSGKGWEPNPRHVQHSVYWGLNAQALFVLSRGRNLESVRSLVDGSETFKTARSEFLSLAKASELPGKDSATDSGDMYVDGQTFYATYLSWPWSVAVSRQLMDDSSLSSAQRRKAKELKTDLLAPKLLRTKTEEFKKDYTFKLAESLVGLSIGIN